MELFKYLFRSTAEQSNFDMFGPIHILLITIAILGSILITLRFKQNCTLEKILGYTLLIQQLSLYTWYIFSGYNTLIEGLPLYHCRIAIICMSIGLIFKNDKACKLGSVWGILGSIAALVCPGLDPFLFPHITQFSFFIGHITLLWSCTYYLFVKQVVISNADCEKIIKFTTLYHITMFILNQILGSNYGYMRVSPIEIGKNLNTAMYGLIVIVLINNAIKAIKNTIFNLQRLKIQGILDNEINEATNEDSELIIL